MTFHLIAIAFAYFLDLIVGDPRWLPHPVRFIGKLISILDHRLNKGRSKKWKGLFLLVIVLLVVYGIGFLLTSTAYKISLFLGIGVETLLIWTTIAGKSLESAALDVYKPLKSNQLIKAREKLSWIVGRDTETLSEQEVVRGTVETVAENTSDGVTAPLFWACIGGAPLALLYRAVNTCDSMVGYKNDRYMQFGWASARVDDLLNIIPSRITGLLMLLSIQPEVGTRKEALLLMLRDAKKHPSPNSGWGEAATAAMLGIQLGGLNYYKGIPSDRAKMGEPYINLNADHIIYSIQILKRTVLLFIILLWLGGLLFEAAAARF
ncbi:adenosylcobinamide-phosphate synthase CbiB [Bacillus taeanensis]|uniref:Cobalamin biosynthesis protein CobD n=1 Tax=Bacillus taeanensis TaxID=273032 RepID=A0A366XVB7_9BACI|nr:adenosylcobinamide-phosphate synthase CbiB [Bacillus taeanensis]RBW70330.1 cobalamin biosynthesis protein CobD [Bacillus taeanensis]